jgi:very-short-patch-repair endonuclease
MEDAEDYVDSESILDMALAVFVPSRDLRWHYRSRHESLIAFSNRHFYDNRLVLFPSCLARHPDLGVEFRFVEGRYTKGGINLPEIQAVTTAAADFMRRFPKKSLGIATMNIAQADLLQEEMDALFAQHEDLEAYRAFWAGKLESLFIKNLERVQGDERDAIFISLVYGPDESGRVLQRFGPINSEMGYRRLNVLLTRAKEKVVVFSSMRHSDVIPTPTSHEGVRVLRDYLRYAETGRMEVPMPSGRPPDSEFEETVAERLRRHGYEIVAQVGEAGYFIDLAVRSQKRPDTYLLGIECDGATYHSAKSARDRDRLRQEVLESLGWKLYRIWSTDWFENPDRETQKLVGLVKRLAAAEEVSGQPE